VSAPRVTRASGISGKRDDRNSLVIPGRMGGGRKKKSRKKKKSSLSCKEREKGKRGGTKTPPDLIPAPRRKGKCAKLRRSLPRICGEKRKKRECDKPIFLTGGRAGKGEKKGRPRASAEEDFALYHTGGCTAEGNKKKEKMQGGDSYDLLARKKNKRGKICGRRIPKSRSIGVRAGTRKIEGSFYSFRPSKIEEGPGGIERRNSPAPGEKKTSRACS